MTEGGEGDTGASPGLGNEGIVRTESVTVPQPEVKLSASDILTRSKWRVKSVLDQPTEEELRLQEEERRKQQELVGAQREKEKDRQEELRLVTVNDKLVKIAEDPDLRDFLRAVAKAKEQPRGEIVLLTHNFGTEEAPNVLPVIKLDQDGHLFIPGSTVPTAEDFKIWQEFGIVTQNDEVSSDEAGETLYKKMYSGITKGKEEKIPPIIEKGKKTFYSTKKQVVEGPLVRWFYTLPTVFGPFTPEDLDSNFAANLEVMEEELPQLEQPIPPSSTPQSFPLPPAAHPPGVGSTGPGVNH